MEHHYAARWALQRENATRNELRVRVEFKAVLLGSFDGRIVEVGDNSARNVQVKVGAQNSVLANDKAARVAVMMTEILLQHLSKGGF